MYTKCGKLSQQASVRHRSTACFLLDLPLQFSVRHLALHPRHEQPHHTCPQPQRNTESSHQLRIFSPSWTWFNGDAKKFLASSFSSFLPPSLFHYIFSPGRADSHQCQRKTSNFPTTLGRNRKNALRCRRRKRDRYEVNDENNYFTGMFCF